MPWSRLRLDIGGSGMRCSGISPTCARFNLSQNQSSYALGPSTVRLLQYTLIPTLQFLRARIMPAASWIEGWRSGAAFSKLRSTLTRNECNSALARSDAANGPKGPKGR